MPGGGGHSHSVNSVIRLLVVKRGVDWIVLSMVVVYEVEELDGDLVSGFDVEVE